MSTTATDAPTVGDTLTPVEEVVIRGVDCDVTATLRYDLRTGAWTEVLIDTWYGEPVATGDVDGHITDLDLRRIATDLSAGRPRPDLNLAWTGQVA